VSPDAERRLILIACACALVAALCAVSVFVAWWAGPVALVVGIGLAVAVTLEQRPPEPRVEVPEREGLSSREIARRAARGEPVA
jgi:hypothetical protein